MGVMTKHGPETEHRKAKIDSNLLDRGMPASADGIWVWPKIKQEGQTAGFGPCFHLPGSILVPRFLSSLANKKSKLFVYHQNGLPKTYKVHESQGVFSATAIWSMSAIGSQASKATAQNCLRGGDMTRVLSTKNPSPVRNGAYRLLGTPEKWKSAVAPSAFFLKPAKAP